MKLYEHVMNRLFTEHTAQTTTSCQAIKFALALLVCAQLCSSSKLLRAHSNVRVPNSYFVHLHSSCPLAEAEVLTRELREWNDDPGKPQFVARVSQLLTKAGYGFSAKLSDEALQHVLRNAAVSAVEEDQYISIGEAHSDIIRLPDPNDDPNLWGINELNGDKHTPFVAPCNLNGSGVDAYILDSGIMYDNKHFGNRAEYPDCDPAGWEYNEDQNGDDCFGHGTNVAGVVGSERGVGVAKGVTLFPIRVLNCTGGGSMNVLLAGLECILRHSENRERPAVVNISIYGHKSTSIKRAIESLLRSKITVVAISGNAQSEIPNDACKVSPSSIQGVITVSGHTIEEQVYSRTNMGICVDLLAPGLNVLTVSKKCRTCTAAASGSSVAAPFVTGAAALILEKCPKMAPWEVKHHIIAMSRVNALSFPSSVPRRFRRTTPNLRLTVNEDLCSIRC